MSETGRDTQGPRRRRLLVALDADEDAQLLLEAAAEMAARLHADLAGLFVEDLDLIGLGDNPLIRTVSPYGGVPGAIRRAVIEQSLRRQVAATRAALEHAARTRQIQVSFEVRRGRLAAALETIEEPDFILVRRAAPNVQHTPATRRARMSAATRQVVSSARRPVIVLNLHAGAPNRAFGSIVALYDGSPETLSTLVAAADIADRRGGDGITVLPLANSDAEAEQLGAHATELLSRFGHRPRIAPRIAPDLDALRKICAAQGTGVLVLHARHKLLDGEAMSRLLEDIECSVMVVR